MSRQESKSEEMFAKMALSEIDHKLDLLLQKFGLDARLAFYDDGSLYRVVLIDPPEYFPLDVNGRYVCYNGVYGEARKFYDSITDKTRYRFEQAID